mmetsp:Transcript_19609/g.47225  ORF Transcript_19609/g.47225 Transcript_19609/m.47225 type:complete len:233 (-) Transcript_19609:41-739(-)
MDGVEGAPVDPVPVQPVLPLSHVGVELNVEPKLHEMPRHVHRRLPVRVGRARLVVDHARAPGRLPERLHAPLPVEDGDSLLAELDAPQFGDRGRVLVPQRSDVEAQRHGEVHVRLGAQHGRRLVLAPPRHPLALCHVLQQHSHVVVQLLAVIELCEPGGKYLTGLGKVPEHLMAYAHVVVVLRHYALADVDEALIGFDGGFAVSALSKPHSLCTKLVGGALLGIRRADDRHY